VLTVDGTPVTPTTATASAVSYSTTLAEGTHTVSLTVKDTSENTATSTWSFTVSLPTIWPYIIAAIAVIIVIAAIAILMRRKR
jgi:subtilase family serine protease